MGRQSISMPREVMAQGIQLETRGIQQGQGNGQERWWHPANVGHVNTNSTTIPN